MEERKPNPDQQAVIDNFTDNILLYASAGTGKTFTVAQKVRKILELGLAEPEEILCLTFTIKACDEMREDIASYNSGAQNVNVKTIHSFCYELIKQEAKRASESYTEPLICDDVDQEEILQKLIPHSIARWNLQELIAKYGFVNSIDELYNHDICYLASAGDAEVRLCDDSLTYRRVMDKGLFWQVDYNGQRGYLNCYGWVAESQAKNRVKSVHQSIVCPECKKSWQGNGYICADCGMDLRKYIPPYECKIDEFRPIISMLKHYRAQYGIDSGNPADDYQATYERLKATRRKELFAAVTSRKKSRANRPDGDFVNQLDKYAGRLTHAYNIFLRQNNRLDFDDLIINTCQLLADDGARSAWSKKYKFIVIDEMQDTSELEYGVLKNLFADNRVMLCGDFFQTIYEWRGLEPGAVAENFKKEFNAKVCMLSENYRSTQTLTNASFGYLKNVYPRLLGTYCPTNIKISNSNDGEPIRLAGLCSEEKEAEFIFKYLKKHPVDNPSEVCVMARSNTYISRLAFHLNNINQNVEEPDRLRFFTVDKDYKFFKKPIVKDMLAFWTLLLNSNDWLSVERLTEKYIHGVGPQTVSAIKEQGVAGITLSDFLKDDTYVFGDPLHTLTEAIENCNVVIYDIETTGLNLSKDQIVQIAAIRMDKDGNAIDTFARFVIPTVEMSKGAQNTHGFSLEYIAEHGGISAERALKEFSAFARGAVLAGHNSARFDRVIIDRQLKECNLEPLDVKGEYDTLILANCLYPELKNHKLSTLCEKLNIVNERAHDAFSDVLATAKTLAAFNAQKIIPMRLQRDKSIKRYARRFRPFYERYIEIKKLFADNDLRGVNKYICENFNVEAHYTKDSDRESLKDLLYIAGQKFRDSGSAEATVRELLTDAALAGSQMDVLIKKLNKIPIITVHQSKGCEFKTVILAGVDEFSFPSLAAVESGHEEEEKRVFYVAISRAKEKLIMTYSMASSRGYPRGYSPYVDFIPQNFIEFYSMRK